MFPYLQYKYVPTGFISFQFEHYLIDFLLSVDLQEMVVAVVKPAAEGGNRRAAEEGSGDAEYMKGVRHLCENGVSRLPTKYILPDSDRPREEKLDSAGQCSSFGLPVIDMARLRSPAHRTLALKSLESACREYGFFQV